MDLEVGSTSILLDFSVLGVVRLCMGTLQAGASLTDKFKNTLRPIKYII